VSGSGWALAVVVTIASHQIIFIFRLDNTFN
jgi:hypothetical protein